MLLKQINRLADGDCGFGSDGPVLAWHGTRTVAVVANCNLLSVMFSQERIKIVDLLVREFDIAHPAHSLHVTSSESGGGTQQLAKLLP
jgi:hypothetical protein